MPRWVKRAGVIGVVLALLVLAGLSVGSVLTGLGDLHGPGRHLPFGGDGDDTAPSSFAEATALTVTVEEVAARGIATPVVATGTVIPWEELPVSAETAGLALTEVLVDEGDAVTAGQVLARLNDRELQARMERERAAIAEARATLEAAEAEHRRGHQLLQRNAISEQAVEQRATAVRTAEARLAVAEAGLALLDAQLSQTRILAPADGYVSRRTAVLGQVVQPGAELFSIVRDGRLEVAAQVPEGELPDVLPGQAVRVAGAGSRTVEAEVRFVSPVVDPRTRLGTVRIALPPDAGLRPGMFARVEIAIDRAPVLAVPQEALVWRRDGTAVFVVENGTAALRPVGTGRRQEGWVEITEGLAAGEHVAVAGAGFLKDGDRVRVELAAAGHGTERPR